MTDLTNETGGALLFCRAANYLEIRRQELQEVYFALKEASVDEDVLADVKESAATVELAVTLLSVVALHEAEVDLYKIATHESEVGLLQFLEEAMSRAEARQED